MIDKKFFGDLFKKYQDYEVERRKIISASNDILHNSKKVIFTLHREDIKQSEQDIKAVEANLKKLEKDFGHPRLSKEGAYMAAVEEYVEARCFYNFLKEGKVSKIEGIKLDEVSYLGGICDLTGELVRRAVNKASEGDYKEVKRLKDMINSIMSELVKFDMRGYLRTKYDQAKNSLRKIEEINYEVRLRG